MRVFAAAAVAAALLMAPQAAAAQTGLLSPGAEDPELDLARRYVELWNLDQMIIDLAVGAQRQWGSQAQMKGAGGPSATMAQFLPDGLAESEEYRGMVAELETSLAMAYAEVLDADALTALITFHSSAPGRQVLDRQPQFFLAFARIVSERFPAYIQANHPDFEEGFGSVSALDMEPLDGWGAGESLSAHARGKLGGR